MNSIPPLPVEPGCLYIDNSFLELLQTCPRQLEYNRLLHRIPAQAKPGQAFGTAGHLVLDHRYRHVGSEQPLEADESAQAAIITDFYAKTTFPEDDFRNLNWAIELFIKQYNQRYKLEPFSILTDDKGQPLIEVSFAIPWFWFDALTRTSRLFDRTTEKKESELLIVYTGRIDLIVLWRGNLVVIDHKTAKYLGNSFWDEQKVSPQQIGYCWAFWKTTGKMPFEFCINAIRTSQLPMRTPTGGYAKWWEECFHRDGDYITPATLEEWEKNAIALIEELMWHYARDYMPMKKKWCYGKYGKCGYYDVCSLPEKQRAEMLQSNLFVQNDWNPLKDKTNV